MKLSCLEAVNHHARTLDDIGERARIFAEQISGGAAIVMVPAFVLTDEDKKRISDIVAAACERKQNEAQSALEAFGVEVEDE